MKLVAKTPDKAYLCENLWLPKSHINVDGVKGALTFTITDDRDVRALCLWQETQNHLIVPREFWDQNQPPPFDLVDCRPISYPSVVFNADIVLDKKNPHETIQQQAFDALVNSQGGILQLACGRGKSVIALAVIAHLQVPALIVVDNTQLLNQWRKEICRFLRLSDDEIGTIGDGKFTWQKNIVMATYQTLSQKAATFPQEARRWFGVTIWDEAHHVAAPTFSRSVDLFYGRRYGLTATPNRMDGMHVVYELHLGPVRYKNLSQNLKPEIYFLWTGLSVDARDEQVRPKVCDKKGELHIGKLSGYFGQWEERLDLILGEVKKAVDSGRKVLVLSNSVDEIINMYSSWVGSPKYTDIKVPSGAEVNRKTPAVELDPRKLKRTWAKLHAVKAELKKNLDPKTKKNKEALLAQLNLDLECHRTWEEVQRVVRQRQRDYLTALLKKSSSAGLLTFKVPVATRQKMLETKDVIFSIMKYGKEGLDKPNLDTVILCEPVSQKNILQQVMGRALREVAGKNQPIFVVFEDNIGPMIGMCQLLRKHLREWPVEEGGPYKYTLVGYPNRKHSQRNLPV